MHQTRRHVELIWDKVGVNNWLQGRNFIKSQSDFKTTYSQYSCLEYKGSERADSKVRKILQTVACWTIRSQTIAEGSEGVGWEAVLCITKSTFTDCFTRPWAEEFQNSSELCCRLYGKYDFRGSSSHLSSHNNHSTLSRRDAKPLNPSKIVDADASVSVLLTVKLVHCSKKVGGVSWMTSKSWVQPKRLDVR